MFAGKLSRFVFMFFISFMVDWELYVVLVRGVDVTTNKVSFSLVKCRWGGNNRVMLIGCDNSWMYKLDIQTHSYRQTHQTDNVLKSAEKLACFFFRDRSE